MIIECPHCEAKVDGEVKGEHEEPFDPREDPYPSKVVLLKCPVCCCAILGATDKIQTDSETYQWMDLVRLWPQQDSYIAQEIPAIARNSLIEAGLCFKAKAYSACAVMSGRALEGICRHQSTESEMLAGGLKELKDREIIDNRLYQWGEELRKHRNIGAHATEENITRNDAKNLIEFAQAICDYVYVLNAKFNRFMRRKKRD